MRPSSSVRLQDARRLVGMAGDGILEPANRHPDRAHSPPHRAPIGNFSTIRGCFPTSCGVERGAIATCDVDRHAAIQKRSDCLQITGCGGRRDKFADGGPSDQPFR